MYQSVRASHILVQTEDEAKNLLADINAGKLAFEDAAAMHSLCPSGARGGDLGFFTKGQMVTPFEDAEQKIKKGEVSNPIQTQFGWHLIELTDVKEA